MAVLVAHVGAGAHSTGHTSAFARLLKKAFRQASGDGAGAGTGTGTGAGDLHTTLCKVSQASKVLESSVLTNVSVGSSLTSTGTVENDAHVSVWSPVDPNNPTGPRDTQSFALTRITEHKYPITRCLNHLAVREIEPGTEQIGVTKPCFMVDCGADLGAFPGALDDERVTAAALVTDKAVGTLKYWHTQSTSTSTSTDPGPVQEPVQEPVSDTIGLSLWENGHVVNAVSSGGNFFKPSGRVGCAAVPGASSFCASTRELPLPQADSDPDYVMSALASGNGEQILQLDVCRFCCTFVMAHLARGADVCDAAELLGASLRKLSLPYVGVVAVLHQSATGKDYLVYAHTTESFVFAARKNEFQYVFSERARGDLVYGQMRL